MPRDAAPVTVFETGDPDVLAAAKAQLAAAGIAFYAAGENLPALFDGGPLAGLQPISGPVRVEVAREDARRAREVLAALPPDNE